jgi:cytochrome c biogenesis protein CcmG, thiol:disulfide interchange protein DsbE
MWRYLLPGAIFLVLIGFFVVGLYRDPSMVPSPLLGKPAPAYSLLKVEDPQLKVSNVDMQGKKHLVNVWATWCPECRHEHAFLLQMASENVVPIIGVDWKDELPLAQQWLGQLGNPYAATAFDVEGRTAIDFGVYGAPETFLVNEQGIIVCKRIGAMTDDVWQRVFKPVINNQLPDKSAMDAKTTCVT